jgi:diguanylate cyclase (GGDEF)-like protein/PAS domain S-box-containing protein
MKKEHERVDHSVDTPATPGIYTDAAISFATSLLESSNDLVAAVDTNLGFVAINGPFRREFELVFGKTLHSGDRLDEVLSHLTNDRDKAAALCRRALSGETFRVIEDFGDSRLLRKSYELAFTPIFDTYHQPIFAAIVVRDLSMARVTERRFGPLLEVAPDATIIMRSNGIIDVANLQAERMFGYERHQMLGVPVEDLIPERYRARHVAQRNGFFLRPSTRPMGAGKAKLMGLRANGTEFPVEISLNPLDVDGEQLVVAAVRDMTVRQRAEDELRAQSAELERRVAERTFELERATRAFRATFEQASVGVAHVDLQGNWIRVNDRLCETVGYSREELGTMSFQDITHPDDLHVDLKLMYQLIDGEIPFYTLDKRYVHKSGGIVWISLNVSLVRDSRGAPEYFIAVVKDINDRKRAEADRQRSKESLELAIAATGLGMFDYDPNTDTNSWNDEIKRHFGLKPDAHVNYERSLVGVHPDDRTRVDALVMETLNPASHGHFQTEYRVIGLEDNQERWLEARGKAFFDNSGKPIRFIGTTLDITEKKTAEETLRRSEQQLRLMFESTPIGTVRGKSTGEVIDANSAFLRIVGMTRKDLSEGKVRWDRLTAPEHAALDRSAIEQAKRVGISDLYEKEYIRPDGTRIPVLLAIALMGTEDDTVAFVLDISERKRAEEQIRHTALHDPLTDLPNRGLLFEYTKHVFGRARRAHRHSAILFIDLDRFKPINDNHGHEVGDEVLKEVANRLVLCTRAEDHVFRLGGDEFLVLLPEIEHDTDAGDVARHIAQCLNKPYNVNGLELSLSSSIGIGIYPRDGNEIDTLINNADAAMYQAKQAGRNNIQFYSQELAARSQLQLRIEGQLKTALAQNTFELFYQPLVDMQTSEVLGVEALVRWPHVEIGPDLFVPIAESTGQISRISEWVIAEACRQHKAWRERGMPAIPIAVNISAVQLRDKNFAADFAEVLHNCVLDYSALQIEVTETALMDNLEGAIDVLSRLKALGITIALDDFGTGYSSLNYLSRLPLDKIKVDKSFIQRIEHDASSRAITESVIALGRSLNLQVVAEGIESEETMIYLRHHGCSQAQGYHVCRPLSAAGFEAWLGTHTAGFRH